MGVGGVNGTEWRGEERRRCAATLVRFQRKEGGKMGTGEGGAVGGGGTKTNFTMSHLLNFDKTKILFPFFL